jgi:hypothetical protein
MKAIINGVREESGLPCFGPDGKLHGWMNVPDPTHYVWVFSKDGTFLRWNYEPPVAFALIRAWRAVKRWWWYTNAPAWQQQYARSAAMNVCKSHR